MPLNSTGFRNKSGQPNKIRKRNDTLPLDQLVREGKACAAAIAKADANTNASTQIAFLGNIAQAGRLWTAAEDGVLIGAKIVKLKGPKFVAFAESIRVGRTVAYQQAKLYPKCDELIAWGREVASEEGRWPTLSAMLRFAGPETTAHHSSSQAAQPAIGKTQYRGIMGTVGNEDRSTPAYIFDHQNKIHKFDLDVCADAANAKCRRFFTKRQNALKQEWHCTTAWLNPPYTARMITTFLKKAIAELHAGHAKKVVALLPVWSETPWFHGLASHGHITFLTQRHRFGGISGYAPFPNMLVTFTRTSVRRGNTLSASLLTIPKA